MRIYTLNGTGAISDEEHGQFEVAADGSVEVPHALGERLCAIHIGGKPAWETEGERSARLEREHEEHRRDPATLLAAVEALQAQVAPAEAKPKRSSKA